MAYWQDKSVITLWIWVGISIVTFFGIGMFLLLKNYFKQLKINEIEAKERSLYIQEQERSRIAGELHDNVVSQLNLIRLSNLQQEDRKILDEYIKTSMKAVRTLSHEMAPPHLKIIPLEDLMQEYVYQYEKSIKIEFNSFSVREEEINEEVKLHLFRILQEVVTNCLKHANAACIGFMLRISANYVALLIKDNGKGFEKKNRMGAGLKNIDARVSRLKGKYRYNSMVNKGTTFMVVVPIER